MEDTYTLTEYPEDFWGIPDIALHTCMQVSHIQTLQHEPGPTGPDHQICGLSEPKPQHLYTLYLLSHCYLWYPAHPHSLQEVMTCQEKGHECFKLFIQSNWTAQKRTFSHLMPHCGALSYRTVSWQVQAALSNVANTWRSLTGCSTSRSIAWIHFELRESQTGHTRANAWSCTYKLSRL